MEIRRGVAIVHYDRLDKLEEMVTQVLATVPEGTKVVVCDDGTPGTSFPECDNIVVIKGPNKGVAANKNRALWALQDCHFLAIIEDDLIPQEGGWFEIYEEAATLSQINHFCRVQDKEVKEIIPDFSDFLKEHSYTPIFGPSPRGDFTFITSTVLRRVGGFNPRFRGAGYAHGEWSNRVVKAGLVGHPLCWIDIKEARDKFKQVGDREGGRWNLSQEQLKEQLTLNKFVRDSLEKIDYIHHPLVLE